MKRIYLSGLVLFISHTAYSGFSTPYTALFTTEHSNAKIAGAVFTSTGKIVSADSGKSVYLWTVSSNGQASSNNQTSLMPSGHGGITAITAFKAQEVVALGFDDGKVFIFTPFADVSLASQSITAVYVTMNVPHSKVVALAVSPNEKRLAAAYDDNSIFVWELALNKQNSSSAELHIQSPQNPSKGTFTSAKKVTALAFLDDDTLLSVGGQPDVQRWSIKGKSGASFFSGVTNLGQPTTGNAISIATFPKNNRVAIGYSDGLLKLTDGTGKLIRDITVRNSGKTILGIGANIHFGSFTNLAFSGDGNYLACAGGAGSPWYNSYFFDATDKGSNTPVRSYHHDAPVISVSLNNNGSLLATSCDEGNKGIAGKIFPSSSTLMIWNTTRRIARQTSATDWAYCIAYSPSGRIAYGLRNGSFGVWEPMDDYLILSKDGAHGQVITSLVWVKEGDNEFLITGSRDGMIKKWDMQANKVWEVKSHDGWVNALALGPSPDNKVVAAAGTEAPQKNSVRFWSVAYGAPVAIVPSLPQGFSLPAGSKTNELPPAPEELDSKGNATGIYGRPGSPFHSYWIMCLDLTNNSFVTGSYDNTLKCWNTAMGYKFTIDHGAWIHATAQHPSRGWIATAGGTGPAMGQMGPGAQQAGAGPSLKFWSNDPSKKDPLMTINAAHDSGIFSIAFSQDGYYLASGSADTRVRVWDLRAKKPVFEFLHSNWVYDVAYSPDGKYLASCTLDDNGQVCIYDITNPPANPNKPIE
jgi:WD40 repeat protein